MRPGDMVSTAVAIVALALIAGTTVSTVQSAWIALEPESSHWLPGGRLDFELDAVTNQLPEGHLGWFYVTRASDGKVLAQLDVYRHTFTRLSVPLDSAQETLRIGWQHEGYDNFGTFQTAIGPGRSATMFMTFRQDFVGNATMMGEAGNPQAWADGHFLRGDFIKAGATTLLALVAVAVVPLPVRPRWPVYLLGTSLLLLILSGRATLELVPGWLLGLATVAVATRAALAPLRRSRVSSD